jgi:hypothetical protein
LSQSRGARFIRERWPLLIALWVAVSSNLAIFAVLWPKAQAVDFAVFWRAVHALHPYAANEQPFVYPPTALLWFSPLKLVDVWQGYLIWTVASLILFAAATMRLYGRNADALAMISPAMSVGLIPGQTSLIAAAMLFAAFATECRLCRGVLLGALLTFKPQLAILAPLFLIVSRDWRSLAAMVLTALLLTVIAIGIFGAQVWSVWIGAIPTFQHIVAHRGLSMSAVSPAAFATSLGLPRLPLHLLGCSAALVISVKSARLSDAERAAMIATASLLAAPYALRYDLIAIAPAMASVILSSPGRKPLQPLLACVAYSATFGPLSLAAATAVVRWRGSNAQPVKST